MKSYKLNYMKRITFIIPLFFLLSVFVVYPFVSSLYYSLTQWDGVSNPTFVGLDNFISLFSESNFKAAFANTLFYTFANILFINPLSMALALFLCTKVKGRSLLRTVFYLPVVLSPMVVSYVWTAILTYDGVLNKIMGLFGLEKYTIDWLGNMEKTPWALVGVLVWSGLGSGMIFYIAGLQSISKELYESAAIDGVNTWNKFRYITFPLLMPTITVVTFFGMAGTLKIFDLPFIMTDGGPGRATISLAMLVYKQAFKNMTYGYATATGLIMFIFVVTVSFLQIRLTRSREVEM